MSKQHPHTIELYSLRFQTMYTLWEEVYGTPTIAETQALDKAKNNKKQYDDIVARLKLLKITKK